jgi:hypothetical protein
MSRFRVVAGHTDRPPSCSFDLDADSADAALRTVTTALRALYGRDWWADVVQLDGASRPERGMAARDTPDHAESA